MNYALYRRGHLLFGRRLYTKNIYEEYERITIVKRGKNTTERTATRKLSHVSPFLILYTIAVGIF